MGKTNNWNPERSGWLHKCAGPLLYGRNRLPFKTIIGIDDITLVGANYN